MGKSTKVPYETVKYHLREWDLDLFLVKRPDMKAAEECWFSVRPICDKMGLDAPAQRDRIRTDHRFAGFYHESLPVKTDAGERESFCLRVGKIGTWFTIISPSRMNERFRGKLEALQADIEYKAAEAILGEAAKHLLPPRPDASKTSTVAKGEKHFHCPVCGSPLCMVDDGEHPSHVITGDEV